MKPYDPAPHSSTTLTRSALSAEVLQTLGQEPRRLPTRLLYDTRGSELFELITHVPEYYLTRTELAIFEQSLPAMADCIGSSAWLIELGSGMGTKTHRLLSALHRPAGYTPIDISPSALSQSLQALQRSFPALPTRPLLGDFTQPLAMPDTGQHRRVAFFPGSTLGNLNDHDARKLLKRIARWVGPGGGLLIGIDLVKPTDLLIPAYADARGITAEFNLNLLDRLNREADADFDRDAWQHRAVWNPRASQMESYLVSQTAQQVRIAGECLQFDAGETILTEHSRKYTVDSLLNLADDFRLIDHWTDPNHWFAEVYLQIAS